ncbi:MAG: Na+/H+ antiporter subunit D, partial [Ahrensia sp.]|nr:Na+/H+ antiporter subunit D [Ahrensia sp.]
MATGSKPEINLGEALVLTDTALANWLITAPLILGFVFGALCLMQRKDVRRQAWIAITGLILMLAADMALFWHVLQNGNMVMTMGRWLPPFGITFVADMLGATFALIAGIVGLAGGIYALQDIDETGRRYGFYPFLLLMLAGVTTAFLTGDIFNLYVWFEVLLISSFGLLILGSERAQMDGATKYAFLNLIATTLFLIAVAYLYGLFGTLNMADIARKSEGLQDSGPHFTVAILFLFAFAMKAAAFPLNAWLPASYHTPRIAVSAIFAGLLTKVGVYALLRLFLTLFPSDRDDLAGAIAVIAGLTMVLGAIGALAQTDIRRLLGYLVISGIGLMLAGLALGSQIGLSGSVFYAAHSMIIMTALYLLAGKMGHAMGTFDLHQAGGLYKTMPWLAALCLVLIFAASGLPPFSGLWPKVFLVKGAIDVGAWWLAAAIILSGLLTTIALVRMFAFSFWRDRPDGSIVTIVLTGQKASITVTSILALITVVAGIYPEPFASETIRN